MEFHTSFDSHNRKLVNGVLFYIFELCFVYTYATDRSATDLPQITVIRQAPTTDSTRRVMLPVKAMCKLCRIWHMF